MAAHGAPKRVLVLGGGDGLAVREVLRYASVQQVTLVELDPHMTRLFSTHPLLKALNKGALTDPRVKLVNADAFTWLEGQPDKGRPDTFDVSSSTSPTPPTSTWASSTPPASTSVWTRPCRPAAGWWCRPPARWWRARVSGPWPPRWKPWASAPRRTT
jgi:hypothetical protein